MLGKIRNQAGSWFFKIFLTAIALSFVLWGVGELATGRLNSTAITINGTKIPAQTVSRAYQVALRDMEARAGSELSDLHKQKLRIGERTISSIIRESLLTGYASDLDIRISDKQLSSVLRSMKSFQNDEGKFDKNIYRNALSEKHDMTVEGFEKIVTGQLSRLALNSIFDVPAFSDKVALERIAKTNREEITINTLTIDKNSVGSIKNPTNEEQQTYYENTIDRWQTEEKRSFNVLTVSAEELSKNIMVTDSDAGTFYKDNMDDFNVPEKRQAQHILVKTEEEAKDLIKQINNGSDFSTLAKEHSIDKFSGKLGGDLGQFAATDMVEVFSKAAFALKVGEISEAVKSPFGFHVIKLTGTFPAYLQTFEQAKDEIKKSISTEKAEELYVEMIEQIEDRIAGGDTIQQISTDLKLSFTPYTNKTRWDGMVDSSMLAPVESAAIRSAFTLQNDDISGKIDLTDTNSIYVSVTDIVTPVQQSFEQVKGEILKDMINEARTTRLAEQAAVIYSRNKAGKPLADIAKSHNLAAPVVVENINRQLQNAPIWFSWAQASQLFEYPEAKYLAAPIPHDNEFTIVEVVKRNQPEINDTMLEEDKLRLTSLIGNDLRMQYLKHLYETAKISFNIPLLRQAMPGEPIEESRISR